MTDYDEESRGFLRAEKTVSRYHDIQKSKILTPWTCTIAYALISTSLCVALLAYIATHATSPMDRLPEELDYPKFELVQRTFTGGLKYDEHGNLFRDVGGQGRTYVGNGSGVEAAWRQFDAVQNIELDPSEVSIDGLYIDGRGKAITIPDVFHKLHCLNQIRTALYDPQYLTGEDEKRGMHVDHCIDYLRQSIQCQADLTPLKLFYSESAKRIMVDFEGAHTCRDFDAVLKWAWEHHVDHVKTS